MVPQSSHAHRLCEGRGLCLVLPAVFSEANTVQEHARCLPDVNGERMVGSIFSAAPEKQPVQKL